MMKQNKNKGKIYKYSFLSVHKSLIMVQISISTKLLRTKFSSLTLRYS